MYQTTLSPWAGQKRTIAVARSTSLKDSGYQAQLATGDHPNPQSLGMNDGRGWQGEKFRISEEHE